MIEEIETIAYLSQANKDAPLFLCVMDRENNKYHMFPLTLGNASRLAKECSAVIHTALGGVSDKFSMQDIAANLSSEWGKR